MQQIRLALLNSAKSLGDKIYFGYGLISPIEAIDQQYGRTVNIDPNGTVSGAVSGNFFAHLSSYNRIPLAGTSFPSDQFVMHPGDTQKFSVQIDNDIVDYNTRVYDENDNAITDSINIPPTVFRPDPRVTQYNTHDGITPANTKIFYNWTTTSSTNLGDYKIKIAPCYYADWYNNGTTSYGCSSIFWHVKLASTPVPPVINNFSIEARTQYYTNQVYNLNTDVTYSGSFKSENIYVNNSIWTAAQWQPHSSGSYSFTLVAEDLLGQTSSKIIGPIQVVNDTEAPTVNSFSVNTESDIYEQFKPIDIKVSAKDNVSVKNVTFYESHLNQQNSWGAYVKIGSTLTNPSTTSEFNNALISWTPNLNTYYKFKAIVTDINNNVLNYEIPGSYFVNHELILPKVTISIDNVENSNIFVQSSSSETPQIHYNAQDDTSGISDITLILYDANSQQDLQNNNFSNTLTFHDMEGLGYSNLFPWKAVSQGWHRAAVIATDGVGNKSIPVYRDFFVDVNRPVVVFVPGFLGTEIYANYGGDLGYVKAWPPEPISNAITIPFALNLNSNGIPSNANNTNIGDIVREFKFPGQDRDTAVKDLLNGISLDTNGNNDVKILTAPFDWRIDLNDIATQNKIGATIRQALIESHGQQITILTYSIGALPTRKYLIDNKNDPTLKVKNLINIAPPTLGTLMSINSLEQGDDLYFLEKAWPWVRKNVNNTILRNAVQNMLPIYELLPSQKFIDRYNMSQLGLTSYFYDWSRFDDNGPGRGPSVQTYNETVQYLEERHNSILYQKARSFREIIETGHINSHIKQFKFVGGRYFDPIVMQKFKVFKDSTHVATKSDYTFLYGLGDSIVPLKSADYDPDGNAKVYYLYKSHGSILQDSFVQKSIKQIGLFA